MAQIKVQRCRRQEEVLQRVCSQGFTGCILAAPAVDPTALLLGILPLLAPSASLAAFGPALQPLAECMHVLKVHCLSLHSRPLILSGL